MKQLFMLIACIFLCSQTLSAGEKVIERPQFMAWSSQTIEIDKVVLTDTETVFYIHAFYRPKNRITIDKSTYLQAGDTKLPIIKGEGIELSKEFTMPESGEATFQLYFPALPKGTKTVDFIEGDTDTHFKIYDIRLDGKKTAPLKVGKEWSKPSASAPVTPCIKPGVAKLSITIPGYKPAMGNKTMVYFNNLFTGEENEFTNNIQPDGTLTAEIPVNNTTSAFFESAFFNGWMILSPGETCNMLINLREVTRQQSRLHKDGTPLGQKAYFTGAFASINNSEVNGSKFKKSPVNSQEEYNKFLETAGTLNVLEIKKYVHELCNKNLDELNAVPTLNPELKKYYTATSQINHYFYMKNAAQYKAAAYRKANNLDRNAALPADLLSEPAEYEYSFLKSMDFNSPDYLFAAGYMSVISSLYDKFKSNGNSSPESQLAALLDANSGLAFDLLKIIPYRNALKNFTPLTGEQLSDIKAMSNPAYFEIYNKLNNNLLAQIEENKKKTGYTINEVPGVPNEELFDAIISKYKGKVIFVDFWATWCGPCRSAMKQAEPAKTALAGKDIVYLYLTGGSSPMGKWQSMITDIPGEHYRMDDDQWNYVCNNFKISGIPSYIIVNKEGKVAHFRVGFMGADKMKEMLLEEVQK